MCVSTYIYQIIFVYFGTSLWYLFPSVLLVLADLAAFAELRFSFSFGKTFHPRNSGAFFVT